MSAVAAALLYEDFDEGQVRWLGCSTSPPQEYGAVTSSAGAEISDLCLVERDGKILSVIVTRSGMLFAIDVISQVTKWEAKWDLGESMSHPLYAKNVTSDWHGHLFVSDSNNKCIQMFSVDGFYVGPILHTNDARLQVTEKGPVTLHWIRTFKRTSTVGIVYKTKGKWYIGVITLL